MFWRRCRADPGPDLLDQIAPDRHAQFLRFPSRSRPATARQPHALLFLDGSQETGDAVAEQTTGSRLRIDCDKELSGSRWPACGPRERAGVDAEDGAARSGGHNLDHERDTYSLVAACGRHRALQRQIWIGSRFTVRAERPSDRDCLSRPFPPHDLALGDDTGALVDADRRAARPVGNGEGDGVGSENRAAPSDGCDRCRRVGEPKADESSLSDPLGVIAEYTAIVRVADRQNRYALFSSCRQELLEASIDRRMSEPGLGVDDDDGGLRSRNGGYGLAVHLVAAKMLTISRDISEAMAWQPVSLGRGHCPSERTCRLLPGAGGCKRLKRERLYIGYCNDCARHSTV